RHGPGLPVALACHYNAISDPPAPDLMTLGNSGFTWRIDKEHKFPLIAELECTFGLILHPATHEKAFIRGTRMVTCSMLCQALDNIGVTSVRISAYGFKCPLELFDDPANPEHPECEKNTYDIGRVWRTDHIGLVGPTRRLSEAMAKIYPMLGPIGFGLGSVKYTVTIEERQYKVKIYPALVHLLKSVFGKMILYAPENIKTLKARKANLVTLIDFIKNSGYNLATGVRVEVTVPAETFWDAVATACDQTPLLSLKEYTKPVHPDFQDFKTRVYEVTRDSYLEQIEDLMEHCEVTLNLWHGRNAGPTTDQQRQVCLDLFNCVGWNPGTFKITAWNRELSWWRLDLGPRFPIPISADNDPDDQDPSGDYYPTAPDVGDMDFNLNDLPPTPPPRSPTPPPAPAPAPAPFSVAKLTKNELKTVWDEVGKQLICTEEDCDSRLRGKTSLMWDGGNFDQGLKCPQFRVKCKTCGKRTSQTAFKTLLLSEMARGLEVTPP
ncbi:hypothetical protein OC846_006838, partial [Tilletia horrida]